MTNYHNRDMPRAVRAQERKQRRMKKPVKPFVDITQREERVCSEDTQAHRDAVEIALYVITNGTWRGEKKCVIQGSHEQFARKIFFPDDIAVSLSGMGRYRRALNHLRDYVDADGFPCTGLTTHYKQAKPGSELWFIDGKYKQDDRLPAVKATLEGWTHQEKSQRTERRRMRETLQVLLSSIDATKDQTSYQLVTRVLINIEERGVVPEGLMAEFEAFLATLPAA